MRNLFFVSVLFLIGCSNYYWVGEEKRLKSNSDYMVNRYFSDVGDKVDFMWGNLSGREKKNPK